MDFFVSGDERLVAFDNDIINDNNDDNAKNVERRRDGVAIHPTSGNSLISHVFLSPNIFQLCVYVLFFRKAVARRTAATPTPPEFVAFAGIEFIIAPFVFVFFF